MVIRISKDRINMDDKVLQKPVLMDYGETVVSDNSGTSYTVDLTGGNVFNITLTWNCSFTFSNPPTSGTAGTLTLILTQDGTGSRTVTWPGAVTWASGTPPTLSTSASSVDIFRFITTDAGVTWHSLVDDPNIVSTVTNGLSGKANSTHTHAISNITSLQTTLDGKALASHSHTASLTGSTVEFGYVDNVARANLTVDCSASYVMSGLRSTSGPSWLYIRGRQLSIS